MNKKSCNQKNKILEKIKWLFTSILFILLFFTNYYFDKIQLFIRILILSFLIICMIGTILSTKKGKKLLFYIKMSKNEMQKITWPNYKETLYTTFIVIAVTICISLLLWSLDSIIFRLIAFIISLRF
jgi:preprotein translocase subunit SecE